MKRRELIKGLGALGAMAFIPGMLATGNQINKKLHFVGLGQGGTNAMVHIYEKGISAKYSCITGPYVSHLKPGMEHLFFETPRDYQIGGIHYKKPLAITSEMKAIFGENHRYIILSGLGASVGTGLISSLLDFVNTEHKDYQVICSLPSNNLGRAKRAYAEEKKAEIEGIKNVLIFDQQSIHEDLGQLSIRKIYDEGNELFYKSIPINQCRLQVAPM